MRVGRESSGAGQTVGPLKGSRGSPDFHRLLSAGPVTERVRTCAAYAFVGWVVYIYI
jgi:hypothetical protein